MPHTGRTHQIRKHFQKYLIPIYGDSIYGAYSNSDRMMLDCFSYKFIHPVTNKKMKVFYLKNEFEFLQKIMHISSQCGNSKET
jgi:23S rRNA-/tRNA-specific pseudouridylate synthase